MIGAANDVPERRFGFVPRYSSFAVIVALNTPSDGARISRPPRHAPGHQLFSAVIPPTVITPSIARPSTAGKRSTTPPRPQPLSMLFPATTKRNFFPFGSGLPFASTPATISRIFFSTMANGTGVASGTPCSRSSTQPLMFTTAVRNFGVAGSQAWRTMALSPSR